MEILKIINEARNEFPRADRLYLGVKEWYALEAAINIDFNRVSNNENQVFMGIKLFQVAAENHFFMVESEK